jgi:hypothetical protein
MSLHPHDNEEFAELDARVRRLDDEALTALSARLDVAVLLREVQRAAAGLPTYDVPADPGPPSDAARRRAIPREAPDRDLYRRASTGSDARTGPTRGAHARGSGRGDDPGSRPGRDMGDPAGV